MRKFNFSLQKVLNYRETIEEKLLTELAALRAEHERETAKLSEITACRTRFCKEMKKKLTAGNPEDIKEAYRYLDGITLQVKAQELTVRIAAERKDKKMAEVIEASKDRKILERLRDYKLLEHKKEALHHEQKFLDDIAGIHHSRIKSADAANGGH